MKNIKVLDNIKEKIYKLKNLSRRQKRKYVKIGFFLFGFILLLNISIMMSYLLDARYDCNILNNAYTHAVLPDQSLNQKLHLGVVKIRKLEFDDIEVGDKIVVDGDFNLDVYWVETVVSVNHTTKAVLTSYDHKVASTYSKEDIAGEYIKDANFLGMLYYSASFSKGFILITLTHSIALYVYYHLLITKKETDNL